MNYKEDGMDDKIPVAEVEAFIHKFTEEDVRKLIDKARDLDLEGTEVFDKLPFEKIYKEFNGIGPDRMKPIFREILTRLGRRYLPATIIHDCDYAVGGDKKDFHASNKRLRRNLLKMLGGFFSKWNPWYWVEWFSIRHVIYRQCEKYGWEGFHKK